MIIYIRSFAQCGERGVVTPRRLGTTTVRPIYFPTKILDLRGLTQAEALVKGWSSQAHKDFPLKFESTNPSRDDLSGEIGRTNTPARATTPTAPNAETPTLHVHHVVTNGLAHQLSWFHSGLLGVMPTPAEPLSWQTSLSLSLSLSRFLFLCGYILPSAKINCTPALSRRPPAH